MKKTIYVMLNQGRLVRIAYDNLDVAEQNRYELVIEFVVEDAYPMSKEDAYEKLRITAKKLKEKEDVDVQYFEVLKM